MKSVLINLEWTNRYGKWDYMKVRHDIAITVLVLGVVWIIT